MPALNSDSDTSDSEEELPRQRWKSRSAFPPPRTTASAAASRPNGPSVRPAQAAQPSNAPVPQQRSTQVPPSPPAPSPAMSRVSAFCHGNCVRVMGLQSRVDLNGCPGYVCGDMEKASERWPVTVIKGLRKGVEIVKLRSVNMSIMNDIDSFDPGKEAVVPPEIVSRKQAAVRDHKRRWHRAALHLIGKKFYCSLRPHIHQFADGFDMGRIQEALEDNEACVQSGIPLVYEQFRQIAFASDNLQELFDMYFQVLPMVLKDLPWMYQKFSVEDCTLSEFASLSFCQMVEDPHSRRLIQLDPRSLDIFGSLGVCINQPNPAFFSSTGITKVTSDLLPVHNAIHPQYPIERPCGDAVELLSKTIRNQLKGDYPESNIRVIYR